MTMVIRQGTFIITSKITNVQQINSPLLSYYFSLNTLLF